METKRTPKIPKTTASDRRRTLEYRINKKLKKFGLGAVTTDSDQQYLELIRVKETNDQAAAAPGDSGG